MANKYFSEHFEKPKVGMPPKPEKPVTVPTAGFPQYPDTEQKGLGKV